MTVINNQALVLLRTTELSIAQIAAELGFNNKDHFEDEFRQVCGMRPANFRFKVEDNPEFTIDIPEPEPPVVKEPVVISYPDLNEEEMDWIRAGTITCSSSVPYEVRRIYANDEYFNSIVVNLSYSPRSIYLSKLGTEVKGIIVRPDKWDESKPARRCYFKYQMQDLAKLDPRYKCYVNELDRKAVIKDINNTFGTEYRSADILEIKVPGKEHEWDGADVDIVANPKSIFLYGSTVVNLKRK